MTDPPPLPAGTIRIGRQPDNFDLADDGTIALITDFWPDPYERPASRAHLTEGY
jgi:hypothetical protein